MAKRFDATLKTLIDDHLGDWATFLSGRYGLAAGSVVSPAPTRKIRGTKEMAVLEELHERLVNAQGWDELFPVV